MIREENQRMLSQVENVLVISRLEKSSSPIELTEIDLHEIIKNATRHIDLIMRNKKGDIYTTFNAKNTIFNGNKNHFTNLIINILDNAIKYSENRPAINIVTRSNDKNLELTVSDKGIGMDSNTQKNIFQKFFREQSGDIHNIKGHGLGLSYVKKIIDLHGGRINLKSKLGFGTSFIIKLPLINISKDQ